jgi:uncharacterized protein
MVCSGGRQFPGAPFIARHEGAHRMWLIKLIGALAFAYLLVIVLIYAAQDRILFPTGLTAAAQSLPASAQRIEVETPDGERLSGIRVPPETSAVQDRLMVLGFGGNAWDAGDMSTFLHRLYPQAEVVVFHYRGYAPSTGRASAAALLADAVLVHDWLAEHNGPDRIVITGFSIGAGPAAYLASRRPVAGLILVTPFDSLDALAREHYRWAPVGWLLRHRMDIREFARSQSAPTALIAAGQDTIVPPRRTEPVRRAIPRLVLDRTIAGTGHNDLYGHPAFEKAMIDALRAIEQAGPDDSASRSPRPREGGSNE